MHKALDHLPELAKTLLSEGAVLVGEGSGFDFMVPYHRWENLSSYIPEDAAPNSMGGWKFTSGGHQYDIWPDSLVNYLQKAIQYTDEPKAMTKHFYLCAFNVEKKG